MKTQEAIKRELRCVEYAFKKTYGRSDRTGETEAINTELRGAMQALTWAMGGNAMRPSKAVAPHRLDLWKQKRRPVRCC
jgi:hypothetical protein